MCGFDGFSAFAASDLDAVRRHMMAQRRAASVLRASALVRRQHRVKRCLWPVLTVACTVVAATALVSTPWAVVLCTVVVCALALGVLQYNHYRKRLRTTDCGFEAKGDNLHCDSDFARETVALAVQLNGKEYWPRSGPWSTIGADLERIQSEQVAVGWWRKMYALLHAQDTHVFEQR